MKMMTKMIRKTTKTMINMEKITTTKMMIKMTISIAATSTGRNSYMKKKLH